MKKILLILCLVLSIPGAKTMAAKDDRVRLNGAEWLPNPDARTAAVVQALKYMFPIILVPQQEEFNETKRKVAYKDVGNKITVENSEELKLALKKLFDEQQVPHVLCVIDLAHVPVEVFPPSIINQANKPETQCDTYNQQLKNLNKDMGALYYKQGDHHHDSTYLCAYNKQTHMLFLVGKKETGYCLVKNEDKYEIYNPTIHGPLFLLNESWDKLIDNVQFNTPTLKKAHKVGKKITAFLTPYESSAGCSEKFIHAFAYDSRELDARPKIERPKTDIWQYRVSSRHSNTARISNGANGQSTESRKRRSKHSSKQSESSFITKHRGKIFVGAVLAVGGYIVYKISKRYTKEDVKSALKKLGLMPRN